MRISVFSQDANPAVDRFILRKSLSYCETEVREGRARQVDATDISKGVQLVSKLAIHKSEARGSKESAGCLTAHESVLNSCYRRRDAVSDAVAEGRACFVAKLEVTRLAVEYEHKLERWLMGDPRRKGTSFACNVIAARVKTLLSANA